MDLKTYRTTNNIKMPPFAKAMKKTPQHLYEIERGAAFPSRKLAREIEAYTNGIVTAAELLGVKDDPTPTASSKRRSGRR